MEKKNKFAKNLTNFFWGILYSMPLMFLIVGFIMFYYRNPQSSVDYNLVSNFIKSMCLDSSLQVIGNLFNDYLGSTLKVVLALSDKPLVLQNYWLYSLQIILNWYVLVSLFHLLIDLVLFLPNVTRSILKKAGVKDVE